MCGRHESEGTNMTNLEGPGLCTKLLCADYNVRPLDIAKCTLVIKSVAILALAVQYKWVCVATNSPLNMSSTSEGRVSVSCLWCTCRAEHSHKTHWSSFWLVQSISMLHFLGRLTLVFPMYTNTTEKIFVSENWYARGVSLMSHPHGKQGATIFLGGV